MLESEKITSLLYKGLISLKEKGLKTTIHNFKKFIKRRRELNRCYKKKKFNRRERVKQEKTKFSKNVKFSIVVPLYNTPEIFLCEMIDSVCAQTYPNWELCFTDSSDIEYKYVENIVQEYKKIDERIKYKRLEENRGISENTNVCIELSSGDYIALLDHDDLLHPSALYHYMNVICYKDAEFIYCDEDKFLLQGGKHFEPHFKPDFAIDNLRANDYISHFTVFKKNLLNEVGLFRKELDGSQNYDMVFRLTEKAKNIVHIPKVLYHQRVSENSLPNDSYVSSDTIETGINAIKAHLARNNIKADVLSSDFHPNYYRINYKLTKTPLVSIIIPNKDHVNDLKLCIDSIIEKSTYTNIEILIIENNSTEQATFDYYKFLKTNKKVKVLIYNQTKFNYSKINNHGVKFANGAHLLFLNNDTEVISENWIEEMLMYSERKDVGAVGAKLYYPNDTIQHAGVMIGSGGGIAWHYHKDLNKNNSGYFGRCKIQQNFSAVTAACLMIKKSIFEEVEGFDENLAVAFNDVDFCMKIRKYGYLISWTPFAELYHHESISRGTEDTSEKRARFESEISKFETKWHSILMYGDPYYNVNLYDFSLR